MENTANKSAMVIEGYQVFQEADAVVKQEPIDTSYVELSKANGADNQKSKHEETKTDNGQTDVREVLTQILKTRKDKELSVKTVVEDLLKENLLLPQKDDESLKTPTTSKAADSTNDSLGCVLHLKDPTLSCSEADAINFNINEALLETDICEADATSFDQDLVCALWSKVCLMTPQGQTLQIDLTCYWCNFCNYKTEKKDVLLKHMMEHRFHCKYCKFQSFSRSNVIYHSSKNHAEFKEISSTLKYCTYVPDILQRSEFLQKKRKREEDSDRDQAVEGSNKKSKYDQIESLSMEVEEVNEGGEVSTSTEDKIIIPRSAKRTLPAPVKASALSTNRPVQPMFSPKKLMTGPESSSPKQSAPMYVSSTQVSLLPAINNQTEGSLPVISNIVSGVQAVENAVKSVGDVRPIQPKPTGSASSDGTTNLAAAGVGTNLAAAGDGVTVTSGLCWNCGYCEFITFSQSFLKIHLNGNHQGKPHKYVALLVSSKEEVEKIKESDAKLHLYVSKPVEVQMALQNPTEVVVSPSTSRTERPVENTSSKNEVSSQVNEDEETEEEKKIPISFKCAHCNFSCVEAEKVRDHLKQRHMGCVMYVLDMKAVKMRRKRYLYFCLKKKCNFQTKEADEYLEHVETCTSSSPSGGHSEELDGAALKSQNLTKVFIAKSNNQPQSKNMKTDKAAEYGCPYCIYISNNNTRLKKHVISNHQHMPTVIKNLNAAASNSKPTVNFCRHCLWETREDNELGKHLLENHNDNSLKKVVDKAKPSESGNQATKGTGCDTSIESAPQTVDKAQGTVTVLIDDTSSNQSRSSTSDNRQSSVESDTKQSDTNEDDISFEDKYLEIIGKVEYAKAISAFIQSEEGAENKGRTGRPARSAARKAQIKNKFIQPPPLYKCFHCLNYMAFGTKLMKIHLSQFHMSMPLKIYDCLKFEQNPNQALIVLCPAENCIFSTPLASEVVKHAKKNHGMKANRPDLPLLSNSLPTKPSTLAPPRKKATAATGESYECLYCTDSSMLHFSRLDMKRHLLDNHSGEEFLYRDCIARKLRQQSRYYMCHNLSCEHTFHKQVDYKLHILAHNKTTIYECPKCPWFSEDVLDAKSHSSNEHNGEKLTIVEVDLDLDSEGNLVKLVGGMVIKTEKV